MDWRYQRLGRWAAAAKIISLFENNNNNKERSLCVRQRGEGGEIVLIRQHKRKPCYFLSALSDRL